MFFLIIAGIVLVILGVFVCLKHKNRFSGYRSYSAEVVDFRTRFEQDGTMEYICIVAKYVYNDKEIHADYISYLPTAKIMYSLGDTITIKVHPKSPEIFLFKEDTEGLSAFGSALVIGGLLTVVFHLLFRFI